MLFADMDVRSSYDRNQWCTLGICPASTFFIFFSHVGSWGWTVRGEIVAELTAKLGGRVRGIATGCSLRKLPWQSDSFWSWRRCGPHVQGSVWERPAGHHVHRGWNWCYDHVLRWQCSRVCRRCRVVCARFVAFCVRFSSALPSYSWWDGSGVDSTPHTAWLKNVLVRVVSWAWSSTCATWLFVLSLFLTLFPSVCDSFFYLNLDLYLFLFHVDLLGAISHWHSANWGVWPFGQ